MGLARCYKTAVLHYDPLPTSDVQSFINEHLTLTFSGCLQRQEIKGHRSFFVCRMSAVNSEETCTSMHPALHSSAAASTAANSKRRAVYLNSP